MTEHTFDWLPPAVTQHVALALLHFLWQGTLVAIVLAVILRLLRDRVSADTTDAMHHHSPAPANTRANLRYAIACFGLLIMCVLPVVNLLVIEPPADSATSTDSAAEASGVFLEASGEHHGAPTVTADVSHAQSTSVADSAISTDTRGEDALAGAEPDERAAVASPPAPCSYTSVLQWFFWTWLVGVALLSAWHVAGWVLSQAFRRGGATPPDDVLALVGKIARRMGIHRAVAVRQTLKTAAPMVIGWLKPALVLPASILTGLAPRELEAVLAHELAHVRRHDYLVNLIQTVVETLLFYHPAVWWLSCRIRSEREFCADDLAMRVCQRRDVYARSLVALAEIVRTPSPRAVAATGGRFLARIRRIMHLPDQRSTSPRLARRSALVAVMATACLGIVLIAVAQSQPAKDKPLSGGVDVITDAGSDTLVVQAPDDEPEGEPGSEAADTAGKRHVPADDPKEEPNALGDSTIESLEGTWQATSFRTSDEELNQATRTQSRSFSIVIAGDRFTWKYANGRENHWRFKISPDTDPKQIDFFREDSGTRRLGIYSLKKDELTVCFSTVEPVEERYRPTDFTAKEGSGRILMTVKRAIGVTASNVRPDESKGSSLDVRLIDPATGKPFSYGGVELTRTDDRKSPPESLRSSLSRDVFKFADLPPGRYSINASVRSVHPHEPKYVADQDSPEVEIVAGEDKAISVRMRPVPLAKDEIAKRWPYVTAGTVTDDQGKPVEGVDIYVYVGRGGTIQGWRGATTDAQGNYALRYSGRSTGPRPSTPPLLQGGSFRVWKDGYVEKNLNRHAGVVVARRTPQEQDWEQYPYLRKDPSRVVLPNQAHRIDFVMVSEVVIEGKLVDAQGVPLVKKRMHVTVNQDERLGSDFTDEQGHFQFKRIPPGRAMRFVAEHDRRQQVRSEPIVFERPGQSRVKLRLAIDAETGIVSLKIDSLTDPEAEASPEENGLRIDPTADTPEWRKMIALSRELPPIRSGHGQMTLMRVVLEDGDPDTLIQLTSTKLVLPARDRGGGGGDYRQIRSGDFVLVDHSGRAHDRESKDLVKIGTFTHHRPTIWVTVPPRGTLGILGDVVIAPFPKEKMGRIAAIATPGTEQPLKMSQICLGPLVVGGLYGKTLPFGIDCPFDSGRITPGVYKIQLPDFDRKESRWTVNVSPGSVTRLRFLARSQQVIEKTEEVYSPEPESRKVRAPAPEDVSETFDAISQPVEAENVYSEVMRFLTIAPADLPDGCKLSEPRGGALLAPKGVVLDRKQIAHVAAFFGIVDPLQLKEVQAAVTVVYEEAGARKGIEIGVYALSFSDGEAGKRLVDRFAKMAARDGKMFIRNGALVLHVWRDDDASDSAFKKFREYYRTTEFNWPKPAKGGKGPDGSEPSSESNDRIAKPPPPAVNRLDDQGFALLHRAAIGGDVARVIKLLESGADVNVRQAKFHGAPLQYAATWGHVEVVRVLLDHQAKVDATDTAGRTPLMWAAMEGKTKTVRLLLDRDANVNASAKGAWTPLHYAVDRGRAEMAQLLIDRGADVAARNSLGKTPRELGGNLKLRWPASTTFDKEAPDARQPAESSDKPAESKDPGAESGPVRETPVARTSQQRDPSTTHAPAEEHRDSVDPADYVSMVLRWLPTDTETLIVAKDFTLPDYPRRRSNKHVGFAHVGRSLAVGPRPEPLKEGLANQRVRWAIHGGRNFDVVSAFGTVRQEGASIIRLEAELPEEKIQDLRNRLRSVATDVRSLSQHEVYVFPPNRDEMESWVKLKPWQGKYVVLPDRRTLITASSDAYLKQVLDRMIGAPRDRALPPDLSEWKHVDLTAKAWLLRHLPESSEQGGRLRRGANRKLRGLVWMTETGDKQTFRAVYLPMPGQRVDDIAREPWTMPNKKDEMEIPEELAFLLKYETSPDGTVTFGFAQPGDTTLDADRLRELKEQLEKSNARFRLLFTLPLYLHSSQGIWR